MRSRALSPWLASASLLSLQLALAPTVSAGALPGGGHFVSGHGEIGKAGQSVTVRQSTTTGIINWGSFSVGKKNAVTFDNGSGATLNRVIGGNLSRIAGSLHATGSIYLMNAQGVIVSGTGHIVTGGNFLASSGTISNTNFLEDRRRAQNPSSAIVNHGSIVSGGAVTLTGGRVANTGAVRAASVSIDAQTGDAMIAGTVRAYGNVLGAGKILIIAQSGETKIVGTLRARAEHGSGGAIETSGHSVSIGGSIDAGRHGEWLIDPKNLVVNAAAAKTIDASLNKGTNVKLTTTATSASGPGTKKNGDGDIVIGHAIEWTTSASLTLKAYNAVDVEKNINIDGAGKLVVDTDTSGNGGELLNFEGGSVNFANASADLSIDGTDYTLINTVAKLEAIDTSNKALKGNYALAGDLDLSSVAKWKPIGTDGKGDPTGHGFMGTFEGLGHTVTNMTVKGGANDYMGLFGYLSGIVRDLSVTKSSVTGAAAVGGLVGFMASGELFGDSYAGTVTGSTRTGGLVGYLSAGTVEGSSVNATVSADAAVGGLVGTNFGTIGDSYAKGSVTGGKRDGSDIGGLVGTNGGVITTSYATVAVKGSGDVGGLVGGNYAADSAGQIQNSYAKGAVTAYSGTTTDIGGLVGLNEQGHISDSYSVGLVTGGTTTGGLIGENDNGAIADSYWNKTTSKQKTGVGGGSASGVTGMTTAQLQAKLPAGFSSDVWAINSKINGGLPYLVALKASY